MHLPVRLRVVRGIALLEIRRGFASFLSRRDADRHRVPPHPLITRAIAHTPPSLHKHVRRACHPDNARGEKERTTAGEGFSRAGPCNSRFDSWPRSRRPSGGSQRNLGRYGRGVRNPAHLIVARSAQLPGSDKALPPRRPQRLGVRPSIQGSRIIPSSQFSFQRPSAKKEILHGRSIKEKCRRSIGCKK